MSIVFGGIEYKSGDITDYIFEQRQIRLKHTPDDQLVYLYNESYFFLPAEYEFCSCFLYENLLRLVAENVSPNLEYAVNNSKYKDEKWYEKIVELEQQLGEWPMYRERHISKNSIYNADKYIGFTKYWELLDSPAPKFSKVSSPEFVFLPAEKRGSEDYKKWMERLYEIECGFKENIREIEMKLTDLIGRLN